MAKDTRKDEERRSQFRGAEANIGHTRETRGKTGGEGERGLQRFGGGGGLLQPWGFFSQNPFSFMRRFTENLDNLFEDFWGGRGGRALSTWREPRGLIGRWGEGFWMPQVESFEHNGELVVRADLPGLNKDDVQVEFTNEGITIQGERRHEYEEKKEGLYRSERSYGKFYRVIPLPEGVNPDQAKATFENGVLEITMPAPKLQQHGRRIEIQSGTTGGRKTGREEAA